MRWSRRRRRTGQPISLKILGTVGPQAHLFRRPPSPTRKGARNSSPTMGKSTRSRRTSDTKAILVISADDWPFPIPLVKRGDRLALRHQGRRGRDSEPPHRAQRAQRHSGLRRHRRCRARLREQGPHRQRLSGICAEIREQSRQARRALLAADRRRGEPDRPARRERPRGGLRPQGRPREALALSRLLLPDSRRSRERTRGAAPTTMSSRAT